MLVATIVGWGLELIGIAALILIVGFFVLRLINRKAGDSWWHLFRTKAGQAGDYAKTVDPAGQMRQAALDAAAELKTADEAMEMSERLKAKLQRQVDNDVAQVGRLRAKIKKLLDEGRPENDPEVIEKAKRVAELERAIAQNKSQIEDQNVLYKNTLKSANAAAKKAKAAIDEADRLRVDLGLGEQAVKLAAMFQKYDPTAVNAKMAKIDEYRQAAQDQKDGHTAKLKVMADRSAAFADEDEDDDESGVVTEDVSNVLASIRGTGTATVK